MSKLGTTIYASREHPVLLCLTCGHHTDKIIKRCSDSLRGEYKRIYKGHKRTEKPQKRWARTIRYSENKKSTYHHRLCKAKEILFSYFILDCINKRHKISVRYKPFSRKLIRKKIQAKGNRRLSRVSIDKVKKFLFSR